MKIHFAHEFGMTLCGLDGWRGHFWSTWEHKDSLPATTAKRKVTCGNCRKAIDAAKEEK